MIGRLAVLATVSAAPVVLVAIPAASGAPGITCGSVITESVTLTRNLKDCADGLTVDGPNVTLDLGGRAIKGIGVGAGVTLTASAVGATVTNGSIKGFAFGIYADFKAGEGTLLSRLNVTDNEIGMRISLCGGGGENWTVSDNRVRDNTGTGIQAGCLRGARFVNNHVSRNGGNGISTFRVEGLSVFQDNTINRNGFSGMHLDESNGSVLGNTFNRNGGAGLDISDICETRWFNIYRVGGNTANRNVGLGIQVRGFGTPTGPCIPLPPAPDLDAGGNAAKHNGDPLECTPVVLTCSRNAKDDDGDV